MTQDNNYSALRRIEQLIHKNSTSGTPGSVSRPSFDIIPIYEIETHDGTGTIIYETSGPNFFAFTNNSFYSVINGRYHVTLDFSFGINKSLFAEPAFGEPSFFTLKNGTYERRSDFTYDSAKIANLEIRTLFDTSVIIRKLKMPQFTNDVSSTIPLLGMNNNIADFRTAAINFQLENEVLIFPSTIKGVDMIGSADTFRAIERTLKAEYRAGESNQGDRDILADAQRKTDKNIQMHMGAYGSFVTDNLNV